MVVLIWGATRWSERAMEPIHTAARVHRYKLLHRWPHHWLTIHTTQHEKDCGQGHIGPGNNNIRPAIKNCAEYSPNISWKRKKGLHAPIFSYA